MAVVEFHWIGATGNSVNKYDWNDTNNWIVIDSNTISGAPQRASRLPAAGDAVKIGEKYHCFSPLLFGGYTGGTAHNGGFWNITSLTAGVTDGGLNAFIYKTDVMASDDQVSISAALLYGSYTTQSPATLFGTFAGGNQDFIEAIELINPHAKSLSVTGAAIYSATNSLVSRYPFPYLGGGLTGEIIKWAYTQHSTSYNAFSTYGNVAYAAANAWVGGGLTSVGNPAPGTTSMARAENLGLTVRHGTMKFEQGDSALGNQKLVNINLIHDHERYSGVVKSTLSVVQPSNTSHRYIFNGGTLKNVNLVGDATVEMKGTTAAFVTSDVHTALIGNEFCSFGALYVNSGSSSSRYNIWPVYWSGDITGGAWNAVYRSVASTVPVPAGLNKITFVAPNDPSSTPTNSAAGAPSTDFLSPYIGLGKYQGGTGGSAGYTTIPTIDVNSRADGQIPYQVQFIGSVQVGSMNMYGGKISPSVLATVGDPNEVIIGTVNLANGAEFDFTTNPDFDNMFIGGITGTGNATFRLIGGINVLDDTCLIRPSAGIRMVNTKIIGGVQDTRASKQGVNFGTIQSADAVALQLFAGTPVREQL